MLNVGLTGGIATGKTTVAKMLQEKGADVIDLDLLARCVEKPDRPAWKAIVNYFSADVLNSDRTINREKLGAIVFQDRTKLAKLNDIVHPIIFKEWCLRISDIRKNKPEAIVISDIPLLIEAGAQKLVDFVILVYATPEQQVDRMIRRSGYTREDALKRLASQLPIDEKIPNAHIVIDNSVSLEETKRRVDDLWEKLKKMDRKG